MSKYDPRAIEKKWQKIWEESGAYKTKADSSKPKYYVLDMFPYPSGAGLHVGHPKGYIASDIYARKRRMEGYAVLHPMGWDAFGLPAENYAIKTGTPPQKTTDESIATFKKQISNLALSYDWEYELATHAPGYYKWTQWLFLKFFERGLVYKKKALVNWDPVDQTVLANEQVLADGTAERSGAKVEKRDLEQWFFKITDYADELIEGLDKVDWPESTKINQRNWIGKSEGAEIEFTIANSDKKIKIFTTRPDTLFGATYMVLAPEHPLLADLSAHAENKADIEKYIQDATKKSDIERNAEEKEKTGVEIKGVKAINPASKEEIPIYVADYVLGGYGTGAIMAVPAHDERDFEFAKKFNLSVKEIELEDPKKITEQVGGKMVTTYRLHDWLISRQRYWGAPIPVVYDPEGKPHAVPEEHLPWLLPTDVEYLPKGTSPLGTSKELLARTEKLFGKGWKPEIDTMDTFVCSSWYYLRFADPHNQEAFASKANLERWLPVDLYVGGAEHTVLHLMYARFFTKALRDMGYLAFDEPFLKLRHQGLILAEDGRKMSKRWNNVINPDDMVERFGADALRLYEMFMGPFEQQIAWNTNGVVGTYRFLERVWDMREKLAENPLMEKLDILLQQTIDKVSSDIEAFKFNTAVSALMILSNHFSELEQVPKSAYVTFLKLLHPFAPHITHELAEQLTLKREEWEVWPVADASKLTTATAKINIYVDGIFRVIAEVDSRTPKEEVIAVAKNAAQRWLAGREIVEHKTVYVPGKVVSFVLYSPSTSILPQP
ncbi:MAG: leucine--tRNA ligase [Patescibacteria group bacterium]|nr:leucine--tRNA ligase [Patescibacteria group bacterium]